MYHLDVATLQDYNYDPFLTDILLAVDLDQPTGRRLQTAFPEFFTTGTKPEWTPWSFLQRRFELLGSYDHEEPVVATLRHFNLPLEEFFSHETPAIQEVYHERADTHEYNGFCEQHPRVLTLGEDEVEGPENRFYVLEIIPLTDTEVEGFLVTAVSLQYLDTTA